MCLLENRKVREMKNKKVLTILFLILFLFTIGCSDFINWLGGDLEDIEEIQGEKEGGDETKIFYEEKENAVNELRDLSLDAIKEVEDAEQKRRDVEREIEIDYENKRKQDIDTYKDSEIEKRDKAGNKTYWSNEQDPEF
jgi:hypothetical protein